MGKKNVKPMARSGAAASGAPAQAPQALQAMQQALRGGQLNAALDTAMGLARQGQLQITDLFAVGQRLTDAAQARAAIELYRLWLTSTRSPAAYAVCFNLGVLLSNDKQDDAAEEVYKMSLSLNPEFLEGRLNLANIRERKGDKRGALTLWNEVTAIAKLHVEHDKALYLQALNNMGRVLEIGKQFPEAEDMLSKSLLLDPNQPNVVTHLVHLRQKQCKWPIYEPIGEVTVEAMRTATSALAKLSASSLPAEQMFAAQHFVREKVLPPTLPLAPNDGYAHERLRVGYLSSDLHAHAVAILTAELYELHDRSKVEVYAFSWTTEDGTPIRARVRGAMDHYISIAAMTDEQAAQCIRDHEIDILVDLHGLTSGTRPDILSRRPAPVQMTYLGYPGTTALPCIDYVVADEFVLPPELAEYFTEKPLYMSKCFQINDRKRVVGPKPTRASCRLPEDGFVFCSFNNNFKFTEDVFASWMRILARVPGSVLWMVADHPSVHGNLRQFAEQHGVDPARLVFADRVGPDEYLGRYQAADLFLDTIPFNAGTTASDALWAGLPLLTCAGQTFSSRMAGSLLRAVDLPELITYSLAEYEDKAVALANDPARIAAMKQQLKDNRDTCVLFDSPAFLREYETLLQSVAKRPAGAEAGPRERVMRLPKQTPIKDINTVLNFMVQTVWGLTDPVRFYALMAEAQKLCVPGCYLGDNMFTWGKSNSPFEDKNFVKAWESNAQNDADRAIAWRRYILACSAYHCANVEGDFVECGVYLGTGIKTVIDYFGRDNFSKGYWGYDTYDYNPVEGHAFEGQEDGLFKQVQTRFAGYDQVHLVKGLLPASLENNSPDKIAFLHIDLNHADFEIAVLDALFDRVTPGGMVILDDYEWSGQYREQKMAEDAWFEKRQYRVFPLPTGQGLILKR